MTLEKAIEILDKNIILSPKASQFKEASEVVKFALRQKNIEINLDEAFMKECECEIEKAKEQAVREFAEKVKKNQRNLFNYVYTDIGFGAIIDHLVNEMFGNPEQVKGEENG